MKVQGPEGRIFVDDVPEQAGMPAELTISVFGSPALIEGVKELLQRGANLWPDAMPEVKGLADLVTNGRLMQEYEGVKATGVTHDPVRSDAS